MNAYKHTKFIPFIAIALPVAIIATNLLYEYWNSKPKSMTNPNSHYTVAGVAK